MGSRRCWKPSLEAPVSAPSAGGCLAAAAMAACDLQPSQPPRQDLASPHRQRCGPLACLLILSLLHGAGGLEMVEHVIPSHLRLGETADLVCRYRLQNETLYSVKWYKDNEQFYNFIASPKIAKQMYPLPGIRIDMSHSTAEVVRLLDVGFATAGKYGCEVSVDAPSFHTVIATGHMLVIAVPQSGPQIEGGQEFYRLGDQLEVNCTSHGSKPAALLNWHINGQQAAYRAMVQYPVRTSPEDGLETRQLGLRLTLQPRHFSAGGLHLRCTASLAALYTQHSDLTVALPPKPPQPPAKTLEVKEPSGAIRSEVSYVCTPLATALLLTIDRQFR